jgi:hypothetical protein
VPSIAIIGAGPRGISLLERLVGNAAGRAPGLTIHVIDPHGPGGAVWRPDQSPLMWANTRAEDCTLFTDERSTCAGPITKGPNLAEWAADLSDGTLPHPPGFTASAEILAEASRAHPGWFPTRRLMNAYLSWVFWHTVGSVPARITIELHVSRAPAVHDLCSGGQRIVLSDRTLVVDTVLMATGNTAPNEPAPPDPLAAHAAAHDLGYVPAGSPADTCLDSIAAGEPVLVRGLGLAFVDAMALLTEGRGGVFRRDRSGELRYTPCGREPVIMAGSRRGVPYHPKFGFSMPEPHRLRHFTTETVTALGDRPLNFDADLWPLISAELTTAIETLVPAADRRGLRSLEHPLGNRRYKDPAALSTWMTSHLQAALSRSRDHRPSPHLAIFHAIAPISDVLWQVMCSGRLDSGPSLHTFLDFCRFLSSGPPAPRHEQLLALTRTGLVRFLGADLTISPVKGAFEAHTSTLENPVRARTLLEARLADTASPETDGHRVRRPTGDPHPRRFAIGPNNFPRPRTDSPFFHDNDTIAHAALKSLRQGSDPGSNQRACGIA